MDSPYRPPQSQVHDTEASGHRSAHSAIALLAGLVVPAAVILIAARLVFGDYASGFGNARLWGSSVIGSLLASVAVYRYKRIPLWLAATVGIFIVLLLMVAPSVWTLWLR